MINNVKQQTQLNFTKIILNFNFQIFFRNFMLQSLAISWRHDTQHNGTQYDDTQHDDTHYNDIQYMTFNI